MVAAALVAAAMVASVPGDAYLADIAVTAAVSVATATLVAM